MGTEAYRGVSLAWPIAIELTVVEHWGMTGRVLVNHFTVTVSRKELFI